MNNFNGIGLAFPQIGFSKRAFIYLNKNSMGDLNKEIYLNPEIFYFSINLYFDYEGCLSIYNFTGLVKRFYKTSVKYLNINNILLNINLIEFNSRIVQHEIDHLNGILFVSKLCNLRTIRYIF
jgi:peptide deformylase